MSKAEWLVIVALVSVLVALLVPKDWRSYFDRNPDNSFPIHTFDTQLTSGAGENDPVKIVVTERPRDEDESWNIRCLLINAGKTPIYYPGYSPTCTWTRRTEGMLLPCYLWEVRYGTVFQSARRHNCGHGWTRMRLKPGQAGYFQAREIATQSDVKIGLYYSTAPDEPMEKVTWATVNSTH